MAELEEPTQPQVPPADNQAEAPKEKKIKSADDGQHPHKPRVNKGGKGDKKNTFNKNGKRPNFNNGPRRVSGGIRLRSASGKSGRNWWAQRWIRSMETLVDVNRLRRGRYYAQQGQVLTIDEGDAEMIARVQGSRPKPYTVRISLIPFNEEQWEKLLFVLSNKAIFAAQLLSGQMPVNIEEAFSEAGVSLFPNRAGDLLTDCSCPDWANPCKHVAATHYILGDRFDDDPFLLFRLRGRTQAQIIEGLRRHRLAGVSHPDTPTPENFTLGDEGDDDYLPMEQQTLMLDNETMAKFWVNEDDLSDFAIRVAPPELQFPIFKRLGEPDAAGQYSLEELLGNAYLAVSQASQIIAFMGGDMDEDDDDE